MLNCQLWVAHPLRLLQQAITGSVGSNPTGLDQFVKLQLVFQSERQPRARLHAFALAD
jgi:hypothetical protein